MLMARYLHSLVMVALLFAVMGQSFAAADLPCKMMMQHMTNGAHLHDSHKTSVYQSSAHHSHVEDMRSDKMAHNDMSHMMDMADESDCCKTQCSCPPSGCVPFALALFNSKLLFHVATYTQPRFALMAFIDSPIQSLFKPPIVA